VCVPGSARIPISNESLPSPDLQVQQLSLELQYVIGDQLVQQSTTDYIQHNVLGTLRQLYCYFSGKLSLCCLPQTTVCNRTRSSGNMTSVTVTVILFCRQRLRPFQQQNAEFRSPCVTTKTANICSLASTQSL
jgi:hypothetical protein